MNLKLKNMMTCINNSIGTHMFKNYFYKKSENDKETDVLINGDLSCAYYVSTILLIFSLIDRPHFRVDSTISAMEKHGWVKINKLKVGCIIIWEPIHQNGESHYHIGFYIGDGQAISNRSSLGMPGEHALHYSGLDKENNKKKAEIHSLYWHPDLG